ncbi:zinc finger CONSTANS-like protein [Actinidia rufa]|uniref:Zinc finger CONSTANS-like protein n=1 Tax=Actinidia rufa TaxID=165716 RepID=A0A7J0D9K7_9ERIC|nr:zinc finger CONSTANS-like protein [Actinidia rufa]
MGMGEGGGGGGKCYPAGWGIAAKPCDSCKSAVALLFCRVDSAFLCMGCDAKVHRVGNGHARHERVWMCEVCEQAPASVTCKADAAALCAACDRDIHSANPLARRHERVPVDSFFDSAETVVKSAAAATFLVAADETGPNTETAPPSWVIPDPTGKALVDLPEMKSIDLLFSDSDQLLDFDYPVSLHNSGTDSVVPVQPVKSQQPLTQEMMNPTSENYLEIDFTAPKLNYAAQSLSNSFSSSSMDVGVVPDGSSVSEISYPFARHGHGSVDFCGSVNTTPCQWTDREARVLRYREKRKNRKFEKTIRYASRKAYAETRPRIKGRFAKRSEIEPESIDRIFASGSSEFMAEAAGYGVVPSFL